MAAKPLATALQKDNFKNKFAELVKSNEKLREKYTIQFFETAGKSNYVINGLDGKSINVINYLSVNELDAYHVLKSTWQREK